MQNYKFLNRFFSIRSGVYTTPCKGNEGLHAIAAVGYGTTDKGIKYWAIYSFF